jgi:hypothetical protein
MIFRKWDGRRGMDWIDLAQDRDGWRALVTALIKLSDSMKCREFHDLLINQVASAEGLCSVE